MEKILISNVDGKPALCYDTGLEPRSFARTKMSQCLIEPGYLVYPDGTNKVWKATGVSEVEGFMRVWGVPFDGERLDVLLNKVALSEKTGSLLSASQQSISQAAALRGIVFWIRAKLLLGDINSALNPGAAFISVTKDKKTNGSVFFGPQNLSQRCLLMEGNENDTYNCPDLSGMDAAAFCAGTMLYKILIKEHPYPNKDIYQDMREGVFLPVHLAAPGLDKKLGELIQNALLLPVEKKKVVVSGTTILNNLLEILMNKDGEIVSVSSLYRPVSKEDNLRYAKERKSYLGKQSTIVKTKRFVISNKPVLIGVSIALIFVVFVTASMTKSRASRLTTQGMSSDTVVREYYEAFSNLNHIFMESCVMRGVDKSDIQVATNFFVITKVRQTYEQNARPAIVTARVWRELGGELPAPDVFGVTDLTITKLGGDEMADIVAYRADYLLWFPNEPEPSNRSDELILKRNRGNWKIAELNRTLLSGF